MNELERLKAFTSSELADALDALGVEGALLHLMPLTTGYQLIGPAYTIRYQPYENRPEEFQNAANYIDDVPQGAVIVIDNQGREDCTTWGDILTRYALHKGIAGTVVEGAVRDVASIRATGYPLFSRAVYMRSGKNRVYKAAQQMPICINGITINPHDIIFGDDNGVLVIPRKLLKDVVSKAEKICATEQAILAAIDTGLSLKEARLKYHYHKPWQEKKCP